MEIMKEKDIPKEINPDVKTLLEILFGNENRQKSKQDAEDEERGREDVCICFKPNVSSEERSEAYRRLGKEMRLAEKRRAQEMKDKE